MDLCRRLYRNFNLTMSNWMLAARKSTQTVHYPHVQLVSSSKAHERPQFQLHIAMYNL